MRSNVHLAIAVTLACLVLLAVNDVSADVSVWDATGQWSFDEAFGSPTALDGTANANHGTLRGPTRIAAALSGKALTFDGVGDDVLMADAPPVLKPTEEYAISVWFRYTGAGRHELVSMGNQYAVYVDGSRVYTFFHNPLPSKWTNVGSSPVGANDGEWHHLVGQKTSDGLELWFDGSLVGTLATTDPVVYDLGNDLVLGRWGEGPAAFFAGDLDELWIFDHGLSPVEIQMLFEVRKPEEFIDHFVCYAVEEIEELPVSTQFVVDQFLAQDYEVGEVVELCVPADTNGEGILDADVHLACYEIESEGHADREVAIINQFTETDGVIDGQRLEVEEAKKFCIPSFKEDLGSTSDEDGE